MLAVTKTTKLNFMAQEIIEIALPIWRENKQDLEQYFEDFAAFCEEIELEISN